MAKLKDLETVEEVVERYRRMAKTKPDIFVRYTWDDINEFAEGYDSNGVIPEYAPDLGTKKWKQVVDQLKESYQSACEKLIKGNTWN